MSDTLILQSFKAGPHPQWIERCLKSVRELAQTRDWDYRFIGDELFERLPLSFVKKVGLRGPILSDLGRLIAAQDALSNYQRVIWLDADTLIFNHEAFELPKGQFGFGRERWVQPKPKVTKDGRQTWKVYRSVCNALCYFETGAPFLDYYIYACETIIAQADPKYIAPQMIGPKLLTALNNITPLPLTHCIGSASPHLIIDLSLGEGEALNRYRQDLSLDMNCDQEAGLNLCHSLIGVDTYRRSPMTDQHLMKAIDHLSTYGAV